MGHDRKLIEVWYLRCFETVFQRPYRYFSIALKVFFFFFFFSDRYKTVIGYGLKFVKMYF